MKIKSITFLFMVSMLFSCNAQDSKNGLYEIKRLEHAENAKIPEAVEDVFADHAILYTTDLMPIKGKSGIASIKRRYSTIMRLFNFHQQVEYLFYQDFKQVAIILSSKIY